MSVVQIGSPDADPATIPPGTRGIYIPERYACRKLEVGSNWNVLNVGIRFRQSRIQTWSGPSDLNGFTVGFGLCSGTVSPYGTSDPDHFVGVRSRVEPWTRDGSRNWWNTGWNLFKSESGAGVTSIASGSFGTLRVSVPTETISSAWYLRFTRSELTMKVDVFMPDSRDTPDEFDFEQQLERAKWLPSVNRHGSYQEFSLPISVNESSFGELDSVNLFSDIPNFVSSDLRGIEWVSVRAVRLD